MHAQWCLKKLLARAWWGPRSAPPAAREAPPALATAPNVGRAARPDPRHFAFSGLHGQVCVKLPGDIAGQQFTIEDCEGCQLFLLDVCASVTVDGVSDCAIVIGPTEGSVFLRDCRRCRVAAACAQLRLRDCSGCDLLLRCRTRPVIEDCGGLRLGCWADAYAGLAAQMDAAALSPWRNAWADVHDFTPDAPRTSTQQLRCAQLPCAAPAPHWTPLPPRTGLRTLLPAALPAEVRAALTAAGDADTLCAPRTAGELGVAAPGCFLFLLLAAEAAAPLPRWLAQHTDAYLLGAAGSGDGGGSGMSAERGEARAVLLRSNEADVDGDLVGRIAAAAGAGCRERAAALIADVRRAGTSRRIGVELAAASPQHALALSLSARQMDCLITDSGAAAALFRSAGVDG